MQVNITLFLQMCNFFVAWFLLHKFYFKPAIAVLDAQQKAHDEISSQQALWREYVSKKQHEIYTCWRKLKHFARHHLIEIPVPGQSARMIALEATLPDKPVENPLDGSAHARLVQELTEKIVSEVPHVNL
jgi:hypothetical protein